MLRSYQALLGRPLISECASAAETARALFEAPFAVLCHDGAADPVFTYGNQFALDLWEIDWEALIRMPSRLSAEADNRAARADMLRRATEQGYIDDYSGVRITTSGRRFRIENAVIWTVRDGSDAVIGQAATFRDMTWL